MEQKMFCYQCEQTVGCTACTGAAGVCGKKAGTAKLQDELTGALIGLARAVDGNEDLVTEKTDALMIESLFMTLTNVNFDDSRIQAQIDRVHREQGRMIPRCAVCASPCGRNEDLAAQISNIIIGEMQLLDVLDNLLQPRGNRETAAVRHVAEEHVEIHIALVETVAVVAVAHREFIEITEHRRVFLRSICHCFAHPVLSYLSKFVTLICSPRITSSAFSCSASSLDAQSDASTDTRASGSAALHSTAFEITQMFVTTPTSSIS